jgi:hypothetical protein
MNKPPLSNIIVIDDPEAGVPCGLVSSLTGQNAPAMQVLSLKYVV